jgi:hypothetical protein
MSEESVDALSAYLHPTHDRPNWGRCTACTTWYTRYFLRPSVSRSHNFHRFLTREPQPSDLTDETVSRFIGWFGEHGRKPSTANDYLNRIMALARFAERRLVAIRRNCWAIRAGP